MKKNQTQIKKYAAVISIFLAAVIVGLFVFFFCIKRSVEQRSKNTMRNNCYQKYTHDLSILPNLRLFLFHSLASPYIFMLIKFFFSLTIPKNENEVYVQNSTEISF